MALQRILLALVATAAVLGFAFAAVSTSDFTSHLDRQVHGIHCSLIPGGGELDNRGTSGCHVTLMSPYSSVMRDTVWGGIPVALPAMGVFGFLVFAALALIVLGKGRDVRALTGLLLATAIPFVTSVVMGWISLNELGTTCKVCMGIYATSTVAFVLALIALIRGARLPAADTVVDDQTMRDDEASTEPVDAVAATLEAPTPKVKLASASEMDRRIAARRAARRGYDRPVGDAPLPFSVIAMAALLGVAFTVLPMMAYAAGAPEFDRFVGACGTLEDRTGADEVLVSIGPRSREVEMIEVLDPLCPSCRGFEARFSSHRAADEVSRRALLFPLDSACNWMVSEAVHPGACTLSEAILCADDEAEDVLAWAFEHQDELRAAGGGEDGTPEERAAAVERAVRERFPALGDCIGSPMVQARLNRALRFAVQNELPVLTPQVYVAGTRMCDEDTDLGLDYVLSRLLDRASGSAGAEGGER